MKRRMIKLVSLFCVLFISVSGISGQEKSGSQSIVSELDSLAQKLLQDPVKGSKATYAFLDLNTDDNNTLVEKYITDALTEAVFNTGKVKIIDRANIEKIIEEQKFQASGLVDENQAAKIGNIAGVEYVCFGSVNEIENGYTVNVRVVDVESAEICAMSRTNVKKDSYLKNNSGSSAAVKKSVKSSAKKNANNLWTCTTNRNSFDEYTTYTFILRGPGDLYFFMGYDKYDLALNSKVRAGVGGFTGMWGNGYAEGNYEFKTENSGVLSRKFDSAKWSPTSGWKNDSNSFSFCYNQKGGAKFFLDMYTNNKLLTFRKGTIVQRFQTDGFWDAVEAQGITRQEILDAVANEEF